MDNTEKNFIRSCYLGLGASLLALLFFFFCSNLVIDYPSPFFILFFVLTFASPVIGLVFSIIGIAKTKQAEKKDIVVGSVGMTISALEVLLMIILVLPWISDMIYLAQHPGIVQPHSHNVEINNEDWERMELQRKGYPTNYPEVPIEENFHLTLEDDYTITRDESDAFKDITWRVIRNGHVILERNANGELMLETHSQWIDGEDGDFAIYIIAFVDGQYRRVSNVIVYTHFPSDC